jgi:protocatechuate 3,4-dioxygenase beta subunit
MTEHDHDDHGGLGRDLRVMQRRQLLCMGAGAMLGAVLGCGDDGATDDGSGDACAAIPEETGGPYPGDGTNGANALVLAGIVRSDIRTSIDTASGTAEGVTLTITLTLVDTECQPLAGRAIYLWHCDRDGDYSMYTGSAQAENYLRGVQETGVDGTATFVSIFPACYSGRWPHIHFEVYPSLADAMDAGNRLRTSQLALPKAACDEVFATPGYEASVQTFAQTSLGSDNVFRDGSDAQVAEISGSADAGYVATLQLAVAV